MDLTKFIVRDRLPTQRTSQRWVYRGTYAIDTPANKESIDVSIIAYHFPCRGSTSGDELTEIHFERSHRVVEICKGLSHPNILKFYGTCEFEHIAHPAPVALVFARFSVDLDEFINEKHAILELDQRKSLMTGIAQGLSYLHSTHVVHGGLVPASILVQDDWTPVLSEFGRSKLLTSTGQTTRTEGVVRYSAPETLGMGTANFEKPADVYSFGMVSLLVLSGKIPFDKAMDAAVQNDIQMGKIPRRKRYTEVTDKHWELLEACWTKDAALRPLIDTVLERI